MTLTLVSAAALADLAADADAIEQAWTGGSRLTRLRPRLFERGGPYPLPLPVGAVDRESGGCVSVAVVGARSTSFVVTSRPPADRARQRTRPRAEPSVGGAVHLVRCGEDREELQELAVEMRSPRAILEVLVAQAALPAPSVRAVLRHRDPGPDENRTRVDPRPRAAPLEQRAEQATARALREGATDVQRSWLRSGYAGSGTALLNLAAGCHRLHLLGEPTPGGSPRGVDVDMQLVSVHSGEVAAQDQSSSADASVQLCAVRPQTLALRYVGAPPRTRLLLVHGRWPVPRGTPDHWAAEARARIAEALHRLGAPPLPSSPSYASLGVTGLTALPIQIVPGACYVAAVAALHANPVGLALTVDVGGHHGRNQAEPGGSSTALAFCANQAESALVKVQAHGSGVVWVLGLWQTARLEVGEVAQ